jgi:hypothetical protein
MIAACDRCNAGKEYPTGVRYDPKVAPRSKWRCPSCGGELRAQRKGEDLTGQIVAGQPPKVIDLMDALKAGLAERAGA